MLVYRICSKREILSIINDNGFSNVGKLYENNVRLNNFKYDNNTKYLHFYSKLSDILYSDVSVGRYICVYQIPDEVLSKYSGVGYYLDYIDFRTLERVTEYAIPTSLLNINNLVGYSIIDKYLDYEDMMDESGYKLIKTKKIYIKDL